jgi:predicted regulator of Ras-like GTPase activity (Roadblock/LC7/MglB family)
MKKIEDILARFMEEVPQFIATDCVNIDSGLSVGGSTSIDPKFDASLASACYSEVVKSNGRALDLLGIGAHTVEDILITTRDAYILLRVIGKEHYVSLVITRRGTLGLARAILKKHEPALLAVLPNAPA